MTLNFSRFENALFIHFFSNILHIRHFNLKLKACRVTAPVKVMHHPVDYPSLLVYNALKAFDRYRRFRK